MLRNALVAAAMAASPALGLVTFELQHASDAAPANARDVAAESHAAAQCAPDAETGAAPAWCFRFVVSNTAGADVEVPTAGTPLEGGVFSSRLFAATDAESGRPLAYVGAMAKRHADARKATVTVPAGGSVSAAVDLSDAFEFEAGRRYVVEVADGAIGAEHVPQAAARKDLRTRDFVAGDASVAPHAKRRSAAARQKRSPVAQYATNQCSSGELSQLTTAVAGANTGVDDAINYLVTNKCSGPDYREWFGKPSQARFKEAIDTYEKMKDVLNDDDYILDCSEDGCPANTYAYVFPNDPDLTVHLCSVFWQVSNSLQPDSQPGTIVHELSHFIVVGATDDHEYGPPACRQLAENEPNKAVNNGDSMEYFVEFDPDSTDDCDVCADSGATTCDSCTSDSRCGFCNSTGECLGASATCEVWFPDSECIQKASAAGASTIAAIAAAGAAIVAAAFAGRRE